MVSVCIYQCGFLCACTNGSDLLTIKKLFLPWHSKLKKVQLVNFKFVYIKNVTMFDVLIFYGSVGNIRQIQNDIVFCMNCLMKNSSLPVMNCWAVDDVTFMVIDFNLNRSSESVSLLAEADIVCIVDCKECVQNWRWKANVFTSRMTELKTKCFHSIRVRDEKQGFLQDQSLVWNNECFYFINVREQKANMFAASKMLH